MIIIKYERYTIKAPSVLIILEIWENIKTETFGIVTTTPSPILWFQWMVINLPKAVALYYSNPMSLQFLAITIFFTKRWHTKFSVLGLACSCAIAILYRGPADFPANICHKTYWNKFQWYLKNQLCFTVSEYFFWGGSVDKTSPSWQWLWNYYMIIISSGGEWTVFVLFRVTMYLMERHVS